MHDEEPGYIEHGGMDQIKESEDAGDESKVIYTWCFLV